MTTGLQFSVKLGTLLKASANITKRPVEQTFAAERNRLETTMLAALTWIVLTTAISLLLRGHRVDMREAWVTYGYAQEWIPPALIGEIMQAAGRPRIFFMQAGFKFVDFYVLFWQNTGLVDSVGSLILSIAGYFMSVLSDWQRYIVKVILSPVLFLIRAGAYYYLALLMGGKGQFRRFVSLLVVINLPITIYSMLIDYLPFAGGRIAALFSDSPDMLNLAWYYAMTTPVDLLNLFVAGFWLVLLYFAIKTEHEIAWWRAIICTVISYPISFLLSAIQTYGLLSLIEAIRA